MPDNLASDIPLIGTSEKKNIYAHFYGVIGDWYISEISQDKEEAYGFINIYIEPAWEMNSLFKNCSNWSSFSIKQLQEMINNKFIKEKDICYLITRDISWSPKAFEDINTNNLTLKYPGISDRL